MLKAVYANEEDIPAEYRSLYTERNGQWEIQVDGMKTPGDTDRLQRALDSEREDHKSTRAKLRGFEWVGELTENGLRDLNDKIEDLEANGNSDKGPTEEEIEARVEKKVERALRDPLKKIAELTNENSSHLNAIGLHEAAGNQRRIKDHVDSILTGKEAIQVVDGAREDIVPFAERIMTVNAEGKVVTKEGAGFDAGLSFGDVLGDLKTAGKRGHWFPGNVSGGAKDSQGNPVATGDNPFVEGDSFNMTQVAKIVAADKPRALLLAKQAKRFDLIKTLGLDPTG